MIGVICNIDIVDIASIDDVIDLIDIIHIIDIIDIIGIIAAWKGAGMRKFGSRHHASKLQLAQNGDLVGVL